ncbi:MAG: site-specific integrase, partial [Gemmatimonadota bacterium]
MYHLERFRDYLAFERGLSERTLDAYTRDIRRMTAFLTAEGVGDPGGASPADLREFVYHLKENGLQPSSIRRNLSAVRTYFSFLLAEGLAESDPSEHLESPRAWRRLPNALSRRDIERLLDSPEPGNRLYWRDKAMLEFAYASGV